MDNSIDQIYQEALQELNAAADPQAVEDIRVRYLGRKGRITQFLRNISKLP
ncbi:MAG: phenylalanine--tRNA ligase subunit alpha, partial [Desulfobacterales bacterium]